MKDLVILAFVALAIFGCSALISVGDNNSNTHTYLKISKILVSLAVVAGLSSTAFGYVAMNGSPNINNDTDVVLPISSGDKVLFTY